MDDRSLLSRFPAASIFCNDNFLRAFQLPTWRQHNDSKTLVDRPLRMEPDEALALFHRLPNPLPEEQAKSFLASVFHDTPDDDAQIVPHSPLDYTSNAPSFTLPYPNATPLRDFATDLKQRWALLCRKFANVDPASPVDIIDTAQRHGHRHFASDPKSSLIKLPFAFFIPGGRFREVYYWDSLWIVHGLIASDMVQSAKNAVRNLLYLVNELGFVPNGNRVYYLNRSQPPVLPEAVHAVFEALVTDEEKRDWIEEALPALEKEYYAFMDCRRARDTASDIYSPLAVYRVNTDTPRPESYKEDIHTAATALSMNVADTFLAEAVIVGDAKSVKVAAQVYQDIASGAESGWDFSSRWLNSKHDHLSSIRTSQIIPICLNSVLLRNEKLLAHYHNFLALTANTETSAEILEMHYESATKYGGAFRQRSKCMMKYLWSETSGMWMDYDTGISSQTGSISAAGVMPLWAGAYDGHWSAGDAEKFVNNLMQNSGLVAPGGISATTTSTEEQWDSPNGWTPLLDFVVTGLNRLHVDFPHAGAKIAAEEIAMRGVRTMYNGWRSDRVMHEKYNVSTTTGLRGVGGEYDPQDGFGWTNGVALKLMLEYANEIDQAVPGRWLTGMET